MARVAQLAVRLTVSIAAVAVVIVCLLFDTAAMANTSHAGWPRINGMLLMNKQDANRPLDARPGHDPFDGADRHYSCDGVHSVDSCSSGLTSARSCAARAADDATTGPADGTSSTDAGVGLAPASLPPVSLPPVSLPGVTTPQLPSSTQPAPAAKRPAGCAAARPDGWIVRSGIGHNELLGGHGNDTIHAGPAGDVIWGDYKPSGQPDSQRDLLFGGAGNDFIYSSHGFNHIWTGAGDDHVFLVYGSGVVDCNGPGHKTLVMRRLAQNRHYQLHGCAGATIQGYAA